MNFRVWRQKSLIAILFFGGSCLQQTLASMDGGIEVPEEMGEELELESKNHVAFNAAMHVVLFVLTKNFHIGAFLITILPLVSLMKTSIFRQKTTDS